MQQFHRFNRETIIGWLVASFPILCLAYGKGYQLAPILLLIAALFFCTQFKYIQYTRQVKWLLGTFMAYFGTYVFSLVIHGGKLSDLDDVSRIIMALPIFLLLLRYPPKCSVIINSIAIGSLIAGITAFICVYYFGQGRAFTNNSALFFLKGYMPIQSGDMAMTLGVMSMTISVYYLKEKQYLGMALTLIAAAFGITASFLSGSRGGWIFLPLAILYLVFDNRQLFTKKSIISTALFVSVILLGLTKFTSITNDLNHTLRLGEAIENITTFQKGNSNSSLGVRFELWKSAMYTVQEHPFLGAGYEERLNLRKQWENEDKINLIPAFFESHSHNQYLEDVTVRGLIGLSGLLALFIVPLAIFIRNTQSTSNQHQVINQCGVVSIILMMGYCLSQSYFKHNSGVIFYPIMTVILAAMSITMAYNTQKNNGKDDDEITN